MRISAPTWQGTGRRKHRDSQQTNKQTNKGDSKLHPNRDSSERIESLAIAAEAMAQWKGLMRTRSNKNVRLEVSALSFKVLKGSQRAMEHTQTRRAKERARDDGKRRATAPDRSRRAVVRPPSGSSKFFRFAVIFIRGRESVLRKERAWFWRFPDFKTVGQIFSKYVKIHFFWNK